MDKFHKLEGGVQEQLRFANAVIKKQKETIEQLQQRVPKWISVKDRLPETGVVVLAAYKNSHGKWRRIRAEYIARKTVLSEDYFSDPDTAETEYDDENECDWVAESWHELIDNWGDYSSCCVSNGEVSHWMPLPEPPTQAEEG